MSCFTQPDTIVPGAGADPQHLNRYTYVRNNPIRYNDPTGNETCGYRGGEYVCWNEVENVPGVRVETEPGIVDQGALVAPAHDPNGRCQSFCQRYSPERAAALAAYVAGRSFWETGTGQFVKNVGVGSTATLGAAAVCSTFVGCFVAGAVVGAGSNYLAESAIEGEFLNGGDALGAALEGAVVGGPSAGVGVLRAPLVNGSAATVGFAGSATDAGVVSFATRSATSNYYLRNETALWVRVNIVATVTDLAATAYATFALDVGRSSYNAGGS